MAVMMTTNTWIVVVTNMMIVVVTVYSVSTWYMVQSQQLQTSLVQM